MVGEEGARRRAVGGLGGDAESAEALSEARGGQGQRDGEAGSEAPKDNLNTLLMVIAGLVRLFGALALLVHTPQLLLSLPSLSCTH